MTTTSFFCMILAGLFIALWANPAVAQDSPFDDRDSCIANCRVMAARGDTYVRDRRVDPKIVYSMCVQKCDKRFWKDVESEDSDE